MSDNKLLSENTIRRFMKLANTDALSNNFVTEMYGKKKPKDPEELEEADTDEEINEEEELEEEFDLDALEEQEDDPMAEEEPEGEMDMPEEDPMADAGAEDAAVGAADMSLTEEEARVLVSLGERLAEALGGAEDEVDMGDEDMAEEPPMDDAADLEGPDAPEEDDAAMGGDYSRGAMMEESAQNEIVQEVLKRVTKRLVSQKLRK